MLQKTLEKCKNRTKLSAEEVTYLLSRTEESQVEQIFQAAREMRQSVFGDKVFLYGFVYFSTFCKNNCTFCYFRKDNQEPPRYRKSLEEVVETAVNLKDSGMHLIDLTTGDDPYYTKHPERLAEIVKAVKKATGLAVMVSPGVLDQNGIHMMKDAGADWYALYQETHNRSLYERLRPEQRYEERMSAKAYAADLGLLIEEGLLTGIGDTFRDVAHSFDEMKRMQFSQVRTMSFIPQEGAPLQAVGNPDCHNELMNIAVMRLLFPDVLIPASLDVEGLKGLEKRIMAGANVVTSIIPPRKGFAGVANSVHDINEGYRTVNGIQTTLQKCQVSQATAQEYGMWVANRKNTMITAESIEEKCS